MSPLLSFLAPSMQLFVLPFRDVPVGVIPALGAVSPAIVREVADGVIIVPALDAVAQAQVRDVPGGVSFRYRFHFLSSFLVCYPFHPNAYKYNKLI